MRDEFLVFGSPRIEEDEINEVVACLRSGWLGTGPKVAAFENTFREYKQAEHAAAISSCTAALHLSMLAAGLEPGDEVITTPMTFCATVNAIVHAGANPVLADIDPITQNIDPKKIAERLTPKTKAILPVHFAGRSCDMDPILELAKQKNLSIIEDCAHAIETEYKGRKAGMMGDFGCFSFYVTKNIVTGEGGMVLTIKSEDIARIKVMALHGMSKDAWKRFSDEGYKHYQVTECGYKYNMMDIQAAIGLHQLKRVDEYHSRREQIWNRYNEAFKNLPLRLPADVEANTRHSFHLYTVGIDNNDCGFSRDDFLTSLHNKNIGTGVHYLSIPEHSYYKDRFGWTPEEWPNAMKAGRETVSLPLSAALTDQDVDDVVSAVTSEFS